MKHRSTCVLAFFILFLLIGLVSFDDYGIPWDESQQIEHGTLAYEYVTGQGQNLIWYSERYHGAVFEVFLVFLDKSLKFQDMQHTYLLRHLMNFLLFYAGVFFFYLLCTRQFKSWKIGLMGATLLILSPRIFADSFYNSKDIPFLSLFIISIFTLSIYLEKKTIIRAAIHALVCALLIDIRVLGVLVPFLTLIFTLADLRKKTKIQSLLTSQAVFWILLTAFVIAFWPVLWDGPLYNFKEALKQMSQFPWAGQALYFGNYIEGTKLPWHYALVWILITTPLIYTAAFFIGASKFLIELIKNPFSLEYQRRTEIICWLWLLLPIGSVIVLKSIIYDGWRHLFFIYPAFLIISLKGLTAVFAMAQSVTSTKLRKFSTAALLIITVVSLLSITTFMIKNHPHQNVYFNHLAGKNIRSNFEMDYWGLSYRSALEYILETDTRDKINVSFWNPSGKMAPLILAPDKRNRLVDTDLENSDYFLSEYRYHKDDYPYTDEYYSITVDEAKIMVVYKMK